MLECLVKRLTLLALQAVSPAAQVLLEPLLDPPDEPPRLLLEPPSRDSPVSISRTLICSHCRKVLSLAKNTLGSTLVRTNPLALRSACSGEIGLSWSEALGFWKIPDLRSADFGLQPEGGAGS